MAIHLEPFASPAQSEIAYTAVPYRVRADAAGRVVADSTRAVLVWEPRQIVPSYAVPVADLLVDLRQSGRSDPDLESLPPVLVPEHDTRSAPGTWVELVLDGSVVATGLRPDDPVLADHVILGFETLDWRAEDEALVSHPHNPFARIDVWDSARRVQVSRGGVELADTTSAKLLVETGLPQRWYLPRADVRMDALTRSDTRTVCAYKGQASYFSVTSLGDRGRDLAWSYEDPLFDAWPVRDHLCFFAERTDLILDGAPVERPRSHWSRPDDA